MKKLIKLRRRWLSFIFLFLATTVHSSEPQEILLWPNGAPGSEGKTGDEKVRIADNGERVISNIHKPSLTPYFPSADKATGCAVIVAPGGGHRELWSDHEGHNVAHWLSGLTLARPRAPTPSRARVPGPIFRRSSTRAARNGLSPPRIRRRCSWSAATTTGPTSRKAWPAFISSSNSSKCPPNSTSTPGRATASACGRTTPNPPANGSIASRNGWGT